MPHTTTEREAAAEENGCASRGEGECVKPRSIAYDAALAVVRKYTRPAPGYQLIACLLNGAPAVRAVRVGAPAAKKVA